MPLPSQLSHDVRFGEFALDPRSRELLADGCKVSLQEQAFQILMALLERPGELITRDELFKRVWPNGTVVDFDHGLNRAINKLRELLRDSAERPRFIQTLPRRGYRWMVPVEWIPRSPAEKPAAIEEAERASKNLTGRKVSHYRVLELLGGGGMGVVYKAEDIKLGRRVALKFLPQELAGDPVALQRFEREARAASALDHPNICTIHGVEEHEGQPFIVMQLLEGQTLRERIESGIPLPVSELIAIAIQLATGLQVAHEKGIIHRDIKPANIFITSRGEAKILDFGLAKLTHLIESPGGAAQQDGKASPQNCRANLTLIGKAMGTASYMSPEQIRGEQLDPRTDLFSFGVVLFEMATGQQAFPGDTATAAQQTILDNVPKGARSLNPKIPLKMQQIISRALEKDQANRFQSASEMCNELMRLRRDVSIRHRFLRPIAAVVFLSLLLSGAMTWLSKQNSSPQPDGTEEQLTANSGEIPVTGGAISPDGKYLAYADINGIRLKLIKTGEVLTIPQVATLEPSRLDWSFAWFPDSTRFLASARDKLGEWTGVHTLTTWTISVLGAAPHQLRDHAYAWSVSPDGASVAFTSNPGPVGDREIWLMRPNGEDARKLVETDDSGFQRVQWSADGNRLAYIQRPQRGHAKVSIVSQDLKDGLSTTIVSQPGLEDFLWLPDGRIIYSFTEPPPNQEICNYWQLRIAPRGDAPNENPRRLTNETRGCLTTASVTADGKRLAFRKFSSESSVYVADLDASGMRISRPRRLTLNQGEYAPTAWAADSRTVVFWSGSNGQAGIFKQSLDQDMAEPLVIGQDNAQVPRVSPDGVWVLYGIFPRQDLGSSQAVKLMRVPMTGGPSQLVLTAPMVEWRCPKSGVTWCAIAERSPNDKQLIFSAVDPVKGRGPELGRFDLDDSNANYGFDISPDGTRIAVVKTSQARVTILPVNGDMAHEFRANGWNHLLSFDWASDGKGFFSSSVTPDGSSLLHLDLHGNVKVVWQLKGSSATWGVPSPDGKYLTLSGWIDTSNIWMIQNF